MIVSVGTPPKYSTFLIDTFSPDTFVFTREASASVGINFEDFYDPRKSSTAQLIS